VPDFQDLYTDEEWEEAVGHMPLNGVDDEQFMLLHRTWVWANMQ
jgi:hypothetical protein